MSGYTDCACRDCVDIAVSNGMDRPDLCNDCESAGCCDDGAEDCERVENPEWCENHGFSSPDRCGGEVKIFPCAGLSKASAR